MANENVKCPMTNGFLCALCASVVNVSGLPVEEGGEEALAPDGAGEGLEIPLWRAEVRPSIVDGLEGESGAGGRGQEAFHHRLVLFRLGRAGGIDQPPAGGDPLRGGGQDPALAMGLAEEFLRG